MTRRNSFAFAAILPALALATTAEAEPANTKSMEEATMFDEIFKAAMESKKGLTFYVKGQTIGGGITKIGNGFVEVRSQTASRIVIRIDSIDAVSMV